MVHISKPTDIFSQLILMQLVVVTQDSNSVVECDHNNLAQCGKHAGIVEAEIKFKMWQMEM